MGLGSGSAGVEVHDIYESAYGYVTRRAAPSAIDVARPGDVVVASTDLRSSLAAALLLDARVRPSEEEAQEHVRRMRLRQEQGDNADLAFELWRIVEDPSFGRVEIFADYAEVVAGRVEYRCGRFQDLGPARAYVHEKWDQFVESFDLACHDATHMDSHSSYREAFAVRVVCERTFPVP